MICLIRANLPLDPLGILEEGQIYYRSSQAMINPDTQTAFNVITGNVLVHYSYSLSVCLTQKP